MTDIAVVLLDAEGQVFAGEELVLGNEAMKAIPVVSQKNLARHTDLIEKPLAEPAPAQAGVASSRRPNTQDKVRR